MRCESHLRKNPCIEHSRTSETMFILPTSMEKHGKRLCGWWLQSGMVPAWWPCSGISFNFKLQIAIPSEPWRNGFLETVKSRNAIQVVSVFALQHIREFFVGCLHEWNVERKGVIVEETDHRDLKSRPTASPYMVMPTGAFTFRSIGARYLLPSPDFDETSAKNNYFESFPILPRSTDPCYSISSCTGNGNTPRCLSVVGLKRPNLSLPQPTFWNA